MRFEDEVQDADFGDQRLEARMVKIGNTLLNNPESQMTNLHSSKSQREASYRFFSNEKVTAENILEAHQPVVYHRVEEAKGDVLIIQDTTSLNYDKHPCTKNLGRIDSKKNNTQGMLVHTALAIRAEDDVCLGIAEQIFFDHDDQDIKSSKKKIDSKNIEKKQSYRWIETLKKITKAAPKAIVVCDRESDIFEFFHTAVVNQGNVIVRKSHNRTVKAADGKTESTIEGRLRRRAADGYYDILIEEEKVEVSIKYTSMEIKPTERAKKKITDFLKVNVVQVQGELTCGKSLSWCLLTTLEVSNFEDAKYIVNLYTKRWHIETFHKSLKSGFRIEESRLQDGENIKKLVAMVSITAAKLYGMMHLSRSVPEMLVTAILDKQDGEALRVLMKKENPPTLKEAVHYIANRGGFQKTRLYPDPGVLTLWRGWVIISAQIDAIRLVWNR